MPSALRMSSALKKFRWGYCSLSFIIPLENRVWSKTASIRRVWLVCGTPLILVAINHCSASFVNLLYSLLLILCFPFALGFIEMMSLYEKIFFILIYISKIV